MGVKKGSVLIPKGSCSQGSCVCMFRHIAHGLLLYINICIPAYTSYQILQRKSNDTRKSLRQFGSEMKLSGLALTWAMQQA